ncbi:hypothetical protein ACIP8U_29425 [Streptomyces pseudovenezuelae]|uniref:hypothetical protein n=1 Tax=Streptomyces pseudovenezuelae TaxID=67350 RepID=UPI0037F3EAA3
MTTLATRQQADVITGASPALAHPDLGERVRVDTPWNAAASSTFHGWRRRRPRPALLTTARRLHHYLSIIILHASDNRLVWGA